jgi:chromatin remodeling complex protein RSC6
MMFQRFPWDPRPARKIKKRRRVTTNKGWTNTQKEMRGDEVLVEVTGLASGTRAQYVRGVWQYIKANHLQIPNEGRRIIPDATLARLMGIEGRPFKAFTMLRYIERHLQKNEAGNETA